MAGPGASQHEPSYHTPTTAREAAALLARHGARGRFLAGGQTLIPELCGAPRALDAIVDLRNIPEFGRIQRVGDHIEVGAMVTISAARRALAADFPVIDTCFRHTANSAVRNRATLGGSIALTDPASEISTFLLAYDTEVLLEDAGGGRTVAIREMLHTPLTHGTLVTGVRIPVPARDRAGFTEFLRRRSGGRSLAMALARIARGKTSVTVSGGATQPVCLSGTSPSEALAALDARRADFESDAVRAWVVAAARRALAEAGA